MPCMCDNNHIIIQMLNTWFIFIFDGIYSMISKGKHYLYAYTFVLSTDTPY